MATIAPLITPGPSSTHPFATASTTFALCTWSGHCLGASCLSNDDCDNDWICSNKICSPCCETLSHSSQVVTLTTTATASATPSSAPSNNNSGGLGTTTTIGIGVGAGVFVFLFVGIGVWLCWRRRRKQIFEVPDTQRTQTELDGTDKYTADGEQKRLFAATTAELPSNAPPGELQAVELVELDASAQWEGQQQQQQHHQGGEQEWEQQQERQEEQWTQQEQQENEWKQEQGRQKQFEEGQILTGRGEGGYSVPRPDQVAALRSHQAQFDEYAISPAQQSAAQWPASPVSPEEHHAYTSQSAVYTNHSRPAVPWQEAGPQQSYVAYRPPEAQHLSHGYMSEHGSAQMEAHSEEAGFSAPQDQPDWPLGTSNATARFSWEQDQSPSRESPRPAGTTPYRPSEDQIDPFLQWPNPPRR